MQGSASAPGPCVLEMELIPTSLHRFEGPVRGSLPPAHHEVDCPVHLPAAPHLLQSELADMRTVEVPALESKHREATAKLSSEVARLKHALKEAEAVAAAAQAEAAAAATQSTLQAQLQEAEKGRQRCV